MCQFLVKLQQNMSYFSRFLANITTKYNIFRLFKDLLHNKKSKSQKSQNKANILAICLLFNKKYAKINRFWTIFGLLMSQLSVFSEIPTK